MRRDQGLLAAAALSLLPACGIPIEEYDARVAELRRAEDRARRCGTETAREQARAADAERGLDEMRTQVRTLEKGHLGDEDRALLKRALAEASKVREAAVERKATREVVTRDMRPELEAGVVWIDERNDVVRMVIPEEALFSSGSSNIGPPGRKVLDTVARELKSLPPREVVVASYLDRGPKSKPKDDLLLTADRARKVADYLVRQGLDPEHAAAIGWGAADPVADNSRDDTRVRNRRVEIELRGRIAAPPAIVAPSPPAFPAPLSAPPAPPPAPARAAAFVPANTSPARSPTIVIPPAPVAPPATGDDPGL